MVEEYDKVEPTSNNTSSSKSSQTPIISTSTSAFQSLYHQSSENISAIGSNSATRLRSEIVIPDNFRVERNSTEIFNFERGSTNANFVFNTTSNRNLILNRGKQQVQSGATNTRNYPNIYQEWASHYNPDAVLSVKENPECLNPILAFFDYGAVRRNNLILNSSRDSSTSNWRLPSSSQSQNSNYNQDNRMVPRSSPLAVSKMNEMGKGKKVVAKPPANSQNSQWKTMARSQSANTSLAIEQSSEAKTPKRRKYENYVISNSPHPKSQRKLIPGSSSSNGKAANPKQPHEKC